MEQRLYISEDKYQKLKVKYQTAPAIISKYYEIDIDKINSVADLIILFKAMYPIDLRIYDDSPYYEDLKHLKKDEE